MKSTLVLIALLLTIVGMCHPQLKYADFANADLLPLQIVLNQESALGKLSWMGGIRRDKLARLEQFANRIDQYLHPVPSDTVPNKKYAKKLISLFKPQLIECFKGRLSTSVDGLFQRDSIDLPIRFATKDDSLCVLLTRIVHASDYNTRQSSREIAAKVMTNIVLPSLAVLSPLCSQSRIKYVGLQVFYGTRDFSDRYARSDPQSLALIVDAQACQRFLSLELSQDELMERASIYLDQTGGSLQLIKLHL